MSAELNEIRASLTAANEKVAKVSADVTNLHAKIDAITADQPTAAEWAEVKGLATDLNNSLQVVDDKTTDEPAA